MPSPFPGMDPYIEAPGLWPDVHHEFISKIRAALNPYVLPNYVVRVETRIFISHDEDPGRKSFVPDVTVEKSIRSKVGKRTKSASALQIDEPIMLPVVVDETIEEAFLEIRERKTNTLVTVIEVISPANKIPGSAGRKSYMKKRKSLLSSKVHMVEIDLLRAGEPPIVPLIEPADYRIFLSRGDDRQRTRCWPVRLRNRLPVIGIPLKGSDPDVPLDLGALLTAVYDSGAYYTTIDYSKPPLPPLSPSDARWANKLLRDKGLR